MEKKVRDNTNKIKDKDGFIRKAILKYGDKYTYDDIVYTKLGDTVYNIYCTIHKEYFNINGNNFIYNCKIGCPICIHEKAKVHKHMSQEEFIRRVTEVHNDKYDFSNAIFKGYNYKVEVLCNTCNQKFYPFVTNLIRGSNCTYCAEVNKEYKWKDTPTKFYVLELEYQGQKLYKIGITIRSIERRYKRELKDGIKYDIIFNREFDEGKIPFSLEQRLRGKLNDFNYKGESPFKRTGTNELFLVNPLGYIDITLVEILNEKGNQK